MKLTSKVLCTVMIGFAALLLVPRVQAAVTDSDKKFLAAASQGDINEIKLSELAEQKATNPAVRAFAHKMVVEHKALELKMKPYADAWGIAPATDVDAAHQDEWNKLNGLAGTDFDKEYIDAMVQDHKGAFKAFTEEVDSTTDAKFKKTVMHGKSVVAAHLNMAESLQKKVG